MPEYQTYTMTEQTKYLLNHLVNIPLLPLLYFQGKYIRKTIPQLPEAEHPEGSFGKGMRSIQLIGLGESTIAGVGVAQHDQGIIGHLSKELAEYLNLEINWKVVARSGYTARRVNEKLVPRLEQTPADIIVIGLGGNDTFKLNSPKQWKKDLEVLIKNLRSKYPEIPIVFTNVPPIRSFPAFTSTIRFVLGRQVDLLHSVLEKVAHAEENVWFATERLQLNYWLDHFEGKYTDKDFFSDGVHPSELTYKTWAEEVAQFIIQKNILQKD